MAVDALARALAAGKVPVDAYQMAVAGGYTGTKEEFEADMGQSGTNATNAANSASAAAASATTALNAAANLAPTYSSSATYAVGDHVLYNGGYYICNSAITTAEAWTAAHWTAVKVGPEITDLENALSDLDDILVNNETIEKRYQVVKKYEFNATISSGGVLTAGSAGRYGYLYQINPGVTVKATNGAVYGFYAVDPVPNVTVAVDSTRHIATLNNTSITMPASAYYIVICSDTGEPIVIGTQQTTSEKMSQIYPDVITLSKYEGATAEDKIYNALVTRGAKHAIECGNITINNTISLPKTSSRNAKIVNSTIRLNADMFTTTATYAHIPTFINCRFVGNGHSIFAGNYGLYGWFVNCLFEDCSITNNSNGLVQSLNIQGCEIKNDTVPFVKANGILGTNILDCLCEAQSATLIDTIESTDIYGGTHDLFVSNCSIESYTTKVFKLSGGSIIIKDCYFESNLKGIAEIKRNTSVNAGNILNFELSGCFVYSSEDTTESSEDPTSAVDAFIIDGFTKSPSVVISVHNNYYETHNNLDFPMISGVVGDNEFVVYNNRKTNNNVIVCADALPVYDAVTVNAPTVDSSLSLEDGGYIQYGALVFLDAVISVTTGSSNLSDAVSGLPNAVNGTPVFTLTEAPYQPLKKYEFNATITAGGVLTSGSAGRYGWCYSVIPGSTITVTKGALYGLYAVDPVPNQTVAADSTRHVGTLDNSQITIPNGVYYIVICSDTGEPYVRVPETADIKLRISGSSADILGTLTQGKLYHVHGFYFTDKKIVQ